MKYWCSLCSVSAWPEAIERREHLVSLNKSFHSVLDEDSASRSDCSWMQSCGEQIGRRHLVSSAKRSDSECFLRTLVRKTSNC